MQTEVSSQSSSAVSEAALMLRDVPQHASNIISGIQSMLEQIKSEEFDMSKGISFLDVRNHTLLSYLINLTYVILQKFSGKQIEGCPSIERLVELRTVLEKMRPIDEKLKYQVQKLLTAATTGSINSDDPLHFKANPDNLVSQFADPESNEESSEEDKEKPKAKSNVYVPPKISATYYDGDETQQTRQQKHAEKLKKRALSSNILQELRQEYDMGPEEIKESRDFHKQKYAEELKERIRYEEEYMLRLPLTKKQKHEAKRVSTISSLGSLTKFDDFSALETAPTEMRIPKKKGGSKKFSKKKGKSKSFKRKR